MLPVCFRSAKMRPNKPLISRAISAWMAAEIFFLWAERVLDGAGAADVFIDLDERALQLLIAAKGLDLALDFALFGRGGETLGDGLAVHLVSQPRMCAVSGIAGPMTMATSIAAATTGSGDRPGTKIIQL